MNFSKNLKDFWLYLNLLFICNYTLAIANLCTTIYVPSLPSWINSVVLIVTYAITMVDIFKNLPKLVRHPNFICIFLFATFPCNILLLPFFLLSVYHLNNEIISKKKIYEKYFFYQVSCAIAVHSIYIGRFAMFSEVFCIPLSFILFAMGRSSILTFVAYAVIVRQQYINNQSMKSVIKEIIFKIDQLLGCLPDSMKNKYFQAKAFLANYNVPKESCKKNN
jgi:transmembrane protein 33